MIKMMETLKKILKIVVKIIKVFLLLFMLIGCGKAYYFLKDKDGNLIIPKTSYKLYTKLSSCSSIEGTYLEVHRNRYKNESEPNEMIVFYNDGSIKEFLANEQGVPKYNTFTEGVYCIEGNKIYIESFYPVNALGRSFTPIILEGTIKDDEIILTQFRDVIVLKKIDNTAF